MSPANPYDDTSGTPAGRVGGNGFVDRTELIEAIEEVWKDGGCPGNLSVLGQIRYGKATVIEQALRGIDRAARADLAIVRISVDHHDSVFRLFRALTDEVTSQFPGLPELERLEATVRNAHGWYDLQSAVTSYFAAVRTAGLHVLLILDKFDSAPRVLADLSGYQLLRSLVSEPRYSMGLVTISARAVFDIEVDAAGGSQLDGVMPARCTVGLLEADEVSALLALATAAGVNLQKVRPELLARAGNHPYLLRILCRRVVREYLESGSVDVPKAHELERNAFRTYFDQLVEEVDLALSGRGSNLLETVAGGGEVPADSAADVQDLVNKGVLLREGESVRLFSDAFASYFSEPAPDPAPREQEAAAPRCTALVVATEWGSAQGGLSTFNREFCLALARQGVRVLCLVVRAEQREVDAAKAAGVTVLRCELVPGTDEMGSMMAPADLPEGVVPQLVIGHGRITGPVAQVQAKVFRETKPKTLHFVHMDPDEIEWLKLDRQDDAMESADNRKQIEVTLGRAADRLVAVGPRLRGAFAGYFTKRGQVEPFQFDPGFDLTDLDVRTAPDGDPLTILLMGRAEDSHIKGLDIAAAACGLVAGWRRDRKQRDIELVVRGVPKGIADTQKAEMEEWADNGRLRIVLRPYSMRPEDLEDDLFRSSLLIMPSRAEGFGLVGQEAIKAGTPVLVSDRSGLGTLLQDVLEERAASWVVPMQGNKEVDIQTWARMIDGMLTDSAARFEAAEKLRVELAEKKPWSDAVEKLLTAMGF
ncbi:glycosyltransferase family 4 protein [Streptomyces sp. NPDC097619]|uniref:glycosyltransferase family 4 protein n=1 Tax=Streptomyces sp. NPDC097619 TaxID=3157228 RepID=UPI003333423F